MRYCSLCKKKFHTGTGSLFRVPNDPSIRARWSETSGKNLAKTNLICSDHFLPSSLAKLGNKLMLLPNAEPFVSQEIIKYPNAEFCGLVQNNKEGDYNVKDCSVSTEPLESSASFFSWEELTGKENPDKVNEKATQTDESMSEKYYQEYFSKIRKLELENKELKLQLDQANLAIDSMRKIFTDGQVRKMMSGGRITWKWKDISNAICLHASGPRAYTHLYQKGFPLPSVRTLQNWCSKVQINEGILTTCIDFMRQTTDLTSEEKICVLAFDEMKVAEAYEYDVIRDVVKKPANLVQVVMARGLKKSWKQPIYYDFDSKITKVLLHEIIRRLYSAGFPVVATVCDMGPSNRKLWGDLGITADKPWFTNPASASEKVFVFADAPHLIKLIRNHFLDSGLIVNNQLLTSRTIEDVMKLTSKSDVSITYKLSHEHLSVKGAGRQKVKLATQLFSHTTANAIRRCYSVGMEVYQATETADLFQLVNDWFDVLNSKQNDFNYPGKEPYGMALDSQNTVLQKMNQLMSEPIIPQRNRLEQFQKGVLITNTALKMLLQYVERYNMKYILTSRLNQDVLENFFSALRSKGGLNDHPSPRDFKYRLRKYIVARNTELLNGTKNNENDSTDFLNASNIAEIQIAREPDEQLPDLNIECDFDNLDETNVGDICTLQEDALEYISGFIIKKLNLEGYESQEHSFTWVDQISKVSLKKPKDSFVGDIKKLELLFLKVNSTEISFSRNILKILLQHSKNVDLPDDIKKLFFKCRIYFRLRHLNKRLQVQKSKQKLMGFSKMLKIKI